MGLKQKGYTLFLTPEDAIDVKLFIRKNEVVKFSLNYRAEIKGRWRQVYRMDSYHGFLHEMRYWISQQQIKLPFMERYPLDYVFRHFMIEIRSRFRDYRSLYEGAKR
jgi:hypothetical protein